MRWWTASPKRWLFERLLAKAVSQDRALRGIRITLAPVNYLAHLYLADDTAASMIGNILPDLMRVPPNEPNHPDWHPEIWAGVRTHRRVDAFTDTHWIFARTRARLRPNHGRYASILVDLFYDHCLANAWSDYHTQSLDDFIAKVHHRLDTHHHLMPEPMARIAPRMTSQNWLSMYRDDAGMRMILDMMSHRLTKRFHRPVDFTSALPTLMAHRQDIMDDFHAFFPALIRYIHPEASTAERVKV